MTSFRLVSKRQFGSDLALRATFIYKNGKDVFGYEDRGGKYELVTRVSPDNGQTYQSGTGLAENSITG